MHETINIHFKMNINNNGEKHLIEFADIGKRFLKNNKIYIKFKEPIMDSAQFNHMMLIHDKDDLTIIRNGTIQMKQTYKLHEVTIGSYQNEYITSDIRMYTKDLKWSDEQILLSYDLIFDQTIIGNYLMEIEVKGV